MQRIQRKFGALMTRSADDSSVASILSEFEEADKVLSTIVESAKLWKDSWTDILTRQANILEEFGRLYDPIAVAGDRFNGREVSQTPQATIDRTHKLEEIYAGLKSDMVDEMAKMDDGVIKPAQEAREYMKPVKKLLKKRDEKKIDFERYQSRYDAMAKKTKLSDREEAALVKHEADLTRATQEYRDADAHLKALLPELTATVAALLPHLLSYQIMIENTILANTYTVLNRYCEEERFPAPHPEIQEILSTHNRAFNPLRREVESSFEILLNGNAVHQPMELEEPEPEAETKRPGGFKNLLHRSRTNSTTSVPRITSASSSSLQRLDSNMSSTSLHRVDSSTSSLHRLDSRDRHDTFSFMSRNRSNTHNDHDSPSSPIRSRIPSAAASTTSLTSLQRPRINSIRSTPAPSAQHSPFLDTSVAESPSPDEFYTPVTSHLSNSRPDYFGRIPSSTASAAASTPRTLRSPSLGPSQSQITFPFASPSPSNASNPSLSAIAAKKKPPPPPPPAKRLPSAQLAQFAIALYDFAGQGNGDLAFREGDRIKIVKKTESVDDWWEGELGGIRGQFPANYCRVAGG